MKNSLHYVSRLYDERTFFKTFLEDLEGARDEVIIESPFITSVRAKMYRQVFKTLEGKDVKVYVITRDPHEHSLRMEVQSEAEIRWYEENGIQTLICGGYHHRKLAFIDRKILWEGSLNILSFIHSREIMRRLEGVNVTKEMFDFLNFASILD